MSVIRFDIFLETAGPGGEARAKAMGIGAKEIPRLEEAYAKLIRLGTTRNAILAALGSPSMHDQSALCYALPSKPGHVFKFRFDALGRLEKAVFVSVSSSAPRPSPGELAKSIGKLKAMGATEEELLAWYGEPDEVTGWWPVETWSYGKTHVELRLGIVY